MLQLRRSTDERHGSDRRRSGKTLEIMAALGAGPVTAAYVLVLLTFGLDAVLPLGTAIWFFYLIPIGFVAMWSSPKQSSHVMILAAICTVLTWVGFFLSPTDDKAWPAIVNRLFAVTVIGITVMLSLARKRVEDNLKVLEGLLPICSYCKKIRDVDGYWEQIERYIAARSEADFTHGMCPDCGTKHFPDVYQKPVRV